MLLICSAGVNDERCIFHRGSYYQVRQVLGKDYSRSVGHDGVAVPERGALDVEDAAVCIHILEKPTL